MATKEGGKLLQVPVKIQPRHINSFDVKLLSQVIRLLCVRERIRCERVSPRWKCIVSKYGWNEQWKLDAEIIFSPRLHPSRATVFEADDLTALFRRVSKHLTELNLNSIFERDLIVRRPFELRSLSFVTNIVKLEIKDFKLQHYVHFLPWTLRELQLGDCDQHTLSILAVNCPKLKKLGIHFAEPKYSNWKTPSLTAIGQLHELEELCVSPAIGPFNDDAVRAVIQGCRNLRSFHYANDNRLSWGTLLGLTTLPNLLSICVRSNYFIDLDSLVQSFAQHRQLEANSALHNRFFIDGRSLSNLTMAEQEIMRQIEDQFKLNSCGCPAINTINDAITDVKNHQGDFHAMLNRIWYDKYAYADTTTGNGTVVLKLEGISLQSFWNEAQHLLTGKFSDTLPSFYIGVAREIFAALQQLHQVAVHIDLQAKNIVFASGFWFQSKETLRGMSDEELRERFRERPYLKLIDFGKSELLSSKKDMEPNQWDEFIKRLSSATEETVREDAQRLIQLITVLRDNTEESQIEHLPLAKGALDFLNGKCALSDKLLSVKMDADKQQLPTCD